jgi:hypothetical protein
VVDLVMRRVPGGLGIAEGSNVVTASPQQVGDHVANPGVVFDDEGSQDSLSRDSTGRDGQREAGEADR